MSAVRTRPVPVEEELPTGADYADAFEVVVPRPDGRTPEQWVRAGLEQAPAAVRRLILVVHRQVLRLEVGPLAGPDWILGWRIVSSTPDVVRLEAAGSLAGAVLVGRRVGPTRMRLTTALAYRRPGLARSVWACVGPLHRLLAPLLLKRACATAPVSR
jgi:hypothetical protein